MLPDLMYLRTEIENNLEEWAKLVEEKKMTTPRVMKTPSNSVKILDSISFLKKTNK